MSVSSSCLNYILLHLFSFPSLQIKQVQFILRSMNGADACLFNSIINNTTETWWWPFSTTLHLLVIQVVHVTPEASGNLWSHTPLVFWQCGQSLRVTSEPRPFHQGPKSLGAPSRYEVAEDRGEPWGELWRGTSQCSSGVSGKHLRGRLKPTPTEELLDTDFV